MATLTLELKTITPLFLGGAYPDNFAELRAPAIKGLLRYWYRAIDPQFGRCEKEIFGGVGAGAGASPFALRIHQPLRGDHQWDLDRYQGPRFRKPHDARGANGIVYLGYSHRLGGKNRRAIAAGQTFKVTLRTTRPVGEYALKGALASAWLLGHLGSAGSRSRRGFGSLALKSWATSGFQGIEQGEGNVPAISVAEPAKTSDEWMQQFSAGLDQIRKWFSPYSRDPDHSVVGPGARVYLYRDGSDTEGGLDGVKAWEHALQRVGTDLQEFRIRERNPDHDLVRDHLIARSARRARGMALPDLPDGARARPLGASDTIRRAAFGLPLMFRYSSLDRANRAKEQQGGRPGRTWERFLTSTMFQGDQHSRNASPLLIRVVEIAGRCHPMVVLLSAPFLARGEVFREQDKHGAPRLTIPPRKILEDFCDNVVGPQSVPPVLL